MGQGLAVVCDENGFPIGIISVIDISPTLAEDGDQAAGTAVREIMATNLVMYALHDSVEEALDRTMERRGRHSPVVAEGRATLSRRVRP
jgi:CBS domain-containing protein